MRRVAAAALLTGVLALAALPAAAHRVNLFAWVEEGRVHTESYFPDGTLVKDGKITVLDQDGRRLLTGTTDEQGAFSFPLPQAAAVTIILDASLGHRTTFRMETAAAAGEEEERGGGGAGRDESAGGENIPDETALQEGGRQRVSVSGDSHGYPFPENRLREIVAGEVSRQLAPVKESLRRLEKKAEVSLSEVIAGIGYIFGIMGVLLYVKSRKDRSAGDT